MRSGFSLVELSIVLVILGLLVGGILAGQSLIRAAELRSVGTDLTRFHTAHYAFRDRFFAKPGDMRNAIDFWGAVHATVGTCITTASTGTLTCNGNGNGNIDTVNGSTASESFHSWIHLANAGLIEGSFTGVRTNTGSDSEASTIGSNIPASRIGTAGFSLRHCAATGCWMSASHRGRNVMFFGSANGTGYAGNPIITGAEGWNIDTKIDDGYSQRGGLTTGAMGDNICDNGNWVLNNGTKACNLIWNMP